MFFVPPLVHPQLQLSVTPRHTGELHITGVAYNLGTGSPASTPIPAPPSNINSVLPDNNPRAAGGEGGSSLLQSILVRGKVILEVQGPRLNASKEEKTGKMYGPDRRLDLLVVPHMPQLKVTRYSGQTGDWTSW